MSDAIDTVYVDVEARGEEDAARDIERAARDMHVSIDSVTKDIRIEFEKAADDMAKSFKDGTRGATDAIDKLADEIVDDLDRVNRSTRDTGEQMRKTFGGGAGGELGGGLLESLSALGAHLRNISTLAPPPIFLAIAAALPAVLALGGAVADLSGLLLLLPAALGSIISVVGALKLAFSGVGDAIKALATGDIDKIKEAMKGLAPSARAFAREINRLRKPMRELRKEVQEAFFRTLRGDITDLVNAALPTLRVGLSRVASAVAQFGGQLFELLGAQDILEVIGDVFEGTARIITNLTPRVINLLGTLFGVAERGMPFLERAFDALGRGLDAVAGFLSGSLQTGSFESFLENAFTIMSDLGDLAVAVFDLLGAIFGDMGDEGSTFIQTLTEMTTALANFFRSAEGQALLQRLVDTLPILLSLFQTGIIVLGALALYTEHTIRALQWLGEKFMWLVGVIGTFFGNLGGWISSAIGWLGSFFSSVGSAIVGVINSVINWVTSAAAAVQAFVGRIIAFVTDLDKVAFLIGFMTGKVIQFFVNMQTRVIQIALGLLAGLLNIYTRIQQFIINSVRAAINFVISYYSRLPGAIGGLLSRMFSAVVSFFSRTRSSAASQTSSLVSQVVSFFRQLPGRVASAISSLPGRILSILRSIIGGARSVGGQIIQGIINGIRGGFGAAVSAAKRVAQGILNGMKSALGIGSPSKLAALEVGRPIMQGVGVGAEDEVGRLRSALNGAVTGALPGITNNTQNVDAGRTVTLATGAVQVVFQGAVPTAQEALRTGQAVGAGILATLQQRQIRSEIRMI